MAKRLCAMGQPNYRKGFEVTVHEHMLDVPLGWRKPQRVFVNSMSDLFHEEVSIEFIQQVFSVMGRAHWHVFQVLTKRAARLEKVSRELDWPPNVWMGVSVETRAYLDRLDCLRRTNASVKFVSFEPLLGPLGRLDLGDIDWAIVGGESGPGARPMSGSWAIEIRDQCVEVAVPFFFKQWGGFNKKKNGRLLDGVTWDQAPPLPNPV